MLPSIAFIYNRTYMNIPSGISLLSLVNPDILFRSVVIYFFVVWFCLVVWVVRDITNRTHSIVFQVVSILMVLFLTPLGIFIYLLLRPQKTLFEQVFESEFLRLDAEYTKWDKDAKKSHNGMDIAHKK